MVPFQIFLRLLVCDKNSATWQPRLFTAELRTKTQNRSLTSPLSGVNKLLPLGSASGYCTCCLYESKISLGHGLQHPLGQTCAIFLLWLCMKGQIDQMSPLVLRTWITDARTVVIPINQTKASLKDLWVCITNSKSKLLTVQSNHGHYVLQWYQQTCSSYICVIREWCHRPALTGQCLNKTQSAQVRGFTKGSKSCPHTTMAESPRLYNTVVSLILFLTNQILLFIIIESTLALFKWREWL